jgi:hypothetical protein
LLYLAQMKVAQQEWEQANVDRAEELLLDQIPQHGEDDLRNVEWRWLWQVTHGEIFRDDSDLPVAGVAVLPDGATVAFGETLRAKPSGGDEYRITLCNTESKQKTGFAVPAGKNFDLVGRQSHFRRTPSVWRSGGWMGPSRCMTSEPSLREKSPIKDTLSAR